MERRKFVLAALLSAPIVALANTKAIISKLLGKRAEKGIIIGKNESRFFGIKTSSKDTYGRCIISSADTKNQLYISSSTDLSNKELGGPGLHIHFKDDEIFYVVSGEFLIQLEDEISLIKKGDTVFIPRGTRHTFANHIAGNPGELLTIHQPISPELEKFYEAFCKNGYMSEEQMAKSFSNEVLMALFENNKFVGPPIDIATALKKLN